MSTSHTPRAGHPLAEDLHVQVLGADVEHERRKHFYSHWTPR